MIRTFLLGLFLFTISEVENQNNPMIGTWAGAEELQVTISPFNIETTINVVFEIEFRENGAYFIEVSNPIYAFELEQFKQRLNIDFTHYMLVETTDKARFKLLHHEGTFEGNTTQTALVKLDASDRVTLTVEKANGESTTLDLIKI